MKKIILSILPVLILSAGQAQLLQQKIDKAVKLLQSDIQMKHAIMSFYVVEAKSGKQVYGLNEEIGLAPASTQKIFTSIAAFELLGKDYRYKTEILYAGKIIHDTLKGNLIVRGSGDPAFGTWRYAGTKPGVINSKLLTALKKAAIHYIDGDIIIDGSKFSYQPLPGGWVWDDIGNYYGAGVWALNWNENQYDLLLKPGSKEGEEVKITGTKPELEDFSLINLLRSGKPGSGDNAYIYMPPYSSAGFVTGTVPAGEKEFIISGAIPDPPFQFGKMVEKLLAANNIFITGHVYTNENYIRTGSIPYGSILLEKIESPSIDSINYWFLQKSINLYGEAIIKTIAWEKEGIGSTEKGVEQLKKFWQQNGIDSSSLNIIDGSGLSPQNRVTAKALVKALQFARAKNWYSGFYNALPLYNGIKMKSGTIGGSKAFTGYHSSGNGIEYTFAIILNNFDAAGGNIVPKIYKLLDELK